MTETPLNNHEEELKTLTLNWLETMSDEQLEDYAQQVASTPDSEPGSRQFGANYLSKEILIGLIEQVKDKRQK